ncbi:hypothetical protein [Xanthobacter sp. YC-JY1]|uniref:hypothetical protein n=1 Tax=Xanthobacter sp. YC-JY1 TaxID=2419844 RepID=UPI001F33E29A|nr:hypothetical protein [Xanthobacter sp. YC-JY1]UJX46610.1 hypothetical protein D7006_19155 [Xanthobacter sp. YC-JY1]
MGDLMTRSEMEAGLAAGRRLIQEEWADPQEIADVDALVAEGKAAATPWEWRDGFQCQRRIVTCAARPEGSTHG